MAIAADLALGLDPVLLAEQAGITPDDWQADVLRSTAPRESFVCRIVGEGRERGALDRLIRELKLEDSVLLMGARDEHVIKELLA